MANTVLTASIIAAEAITILDNELVMAGQVFRGYEDDFDKKVNGYNVGETITIRKPTDFTVRDGAVMAAQDAIEGSTTMTLNKRKGVDFKFTSQDLTTKISDLSERVIKPAMVQLANQVDTDLMALYRDIPNWVGTPGKVVWTKAPFCRMAVLRSCRLPITGACWVRRPRCSSTARTRTPIAKALLA